jgi:hypothetical protein
MFRRWIRNWLLVDLLAFGAGAGSMILYVLYADQIPKAYESYKDIWSNLGIEIFGVWISVRIIDALIGAREERLRVRNAVVGNLNFMMGKCVRLPPHFDAGPIRDIANELTWFHEKRAAPATGRQFAKFLTADERSQIAQVLSLVERVKSLAESITLNRSTFRRATDADLRRHDPQDIRTLFNAARRLDYGDSVDDAEVRRWIVEVTVKLRTGGYASELQNYAQSASDLLDCISEMVTLRVKAREAIAAVEQELANLRRRIAGEN